MTGSERPKTALEFLLLGAEADSEAPAVRMNGIDLSYGSLLEMVQKRAYFFRTCGVASSMKVAIFTDNDLEMIVSLFALWGLGAIPIPMNITQKADKLEQIGDIVKPDMAFYSEDYVLGFTHKCPVELLREDARGQEELHPVDPEDIGMILLTSGTSGVPKAVPVSLWAVAHNAWETSKRLDIQAADKLLINTPPYTTSSIIHVLTMMARGGSVVVERGFLFGSGILEQVSKFNCTGFGGAPVHFSRLLATIGEAKIPGKLRFLMNSGEHLPVPVIEGLRNALPSVRIYCVYGLTEVAGRLCILVPEKLDDHMGSVGVPLEGMSVSVRDETGNVLGPGQEGQVFVEGPCLMEGYLNNPEANATAMTPHGFATGDYGYVNDFGLLFLIGRRDDVFKVGGEKVSCKMIEEAIFAFKEFKEFVVAPVDDQHMGMIPCVYYVLKGGREFDRKKMLRHLKKVLPSTHVVSRFIELSSIPRTSSGKAIRSGLGQHL